jgi:hypothetical protein
MPAADTLVRGATAPIRLGLSAGGLGLSIARSLLEEARRALGDDRSDRADGWAISRETSPPVWSPGPEVRGHGDPLVPVEPAPPAATGIEVGPEIHVEQPWIGYDDMTAAQVRKRLAIVDRSDAAAVSLYEGAGRKRRSVLDAAARRMRALDS